MATAANKPTTTAEKIADLASRLEQAQDPGSERSRKRRDDDIEEGMHAGDDDAVEHPPEYRRVLVGEQLDIVVKGKFPGDDRHDVGQGVFLERRAERPQEGQDAEDADDRQQDERHDLAAAFADVEFCLYLGCHISLCSSCARSPPAPD